MAVTGFLPTQAKPRARPAYRTAFTVLVLGMVATLTISTAAWREHRAAALAELRSEVAVGTRSFQFGIADYVDLVISLQAYAEGSGGAPDARQLRAILARLARGQAAVQGLAYLPRVPQAQRAEFEHAARSAGWTDFTIVEHGPDGRDRPAAERDDYFPAYVFEPFDANKRSLGFDMASDAPRRAAMERARDTGEPAGTALAGLVDDPITRVLVALAPVYSTADVPATLAARKASLAGFAMGAFRIGDMIDHVMEQTGALRDFDHYFFEGIAAGAESLVYSRRAGPHSARGAPAPFNADRLERGIATVITVMDRKWTIVSVPAGAPLFDPGALAWAVLAIGGFGTAAGFWHSIATARRTQELLSLADGLRRSKSAIEREIAERKEVQNQLADALSIVASSSTVLSRWRLEPGERVPRLEYASPNLKRFGWTAEELAPVSDQFLHVVHADDRDQLARSMAAAIGERRREVLVEFRIVGKDGRISWVEGHMTFEWGDASGAGRAVGLLRDITERKAAEQAAAMNMQRLEHFQRLTVGRERDMLRLKDEVNGLLEELGRPQRYAAPARAGELRRGADRGAVSATGRE